MGSWIVSVFRYSMSSRRDVGIVVGVDNESSHGIDGTAAFFTFSASCKSVHKGQVFTW